MLNERSPEITAAWIFIPFLFLNPSYSTLSPFFCLYKNAIGSVAKIIFPQFDTIILTSMCHFSLDDIDEIF